MRYSVPQVGQLDRNIMSANYPVSEDLRSSSTAGASYNCVRSCRVCYLQQPVAADSRRQRARCYCDVEVTSRLRDKWKSSTSTRPIEDAAISNWVRYKWKQSCHITGIRARVRFGVRMLCVVCCHRLYGRSGRGSGVAGEGQQAENSKRSTARTDSPFAARAIRHTRRPARRRVPPR